jgi:hypothetical protein
MQLSKIHMRKLSQLQPFLCALHRPGLDRSGFFARAGKLMLLVTGLLIVGCGGSSRQPTPAIVSVYACSDYCPGPEHVYRKRVYWGVYDKKQCRKLDGEPYTYGLNWVCVVK